MSKLSDEKALKLFRKYEEEIVKTFVECVEDEGVKVLNLDIEGIFDEVLCKCVDVEFSRMLLDDIRDSVGIECYGMEEEEEED